jgi:branched-subunit amino acid aminotransferase/4-amino-4-deoxychorismate lyase
VSGARTADVVLRWLGASAGFVRVADPGERPGYLVPGRTGSPGLVQAADSWLVHDGRVRAFDLHEQRFSAACGEMFGVDRERVREFLLAALDRVPAEGRWFPRAELIVDSGVPYLQFRIRPAPPRGRTIRLWVSPEPDMRQRPGVKGPDLSWLGRQRQAAMDAGADEAVLLSSDGSVTEGSTTSLLWWRGETLCAPPDDGRLLPGVTRSLLLDAAGAIGVPVSFENRTPAELDGLEAWAVNALHGIRLVTAWMEAGIVPGPADRVSRWQAYLDGLSREIRPWPAEAAR